MWPTNLWRKVCPGADNPSLSLCPVNYKPPHVKRHRCNEVGTWKYLVDRKNDARFSLARSLLPRTPRFPTTSPARRALPMLTGPT